MNVKELKETLQDLRQDPEGRRAPERRRGQKPLG